MKNHLFEIECNPQNGGLNSLVMTGDPEKMNWIEGFSTYGFPAGMGFCGMEENGNTVLSRYQRDTLRLDVRRSLEEDGLHESYVFVNTGTFDLYFCRGEVGIYTTFNDNYQDAETCLKKRCHAHIWCGRNNAYVHAKKMGPYPVELALLLTAGALDSYSVERLYIKGKGQQSDDRGDFILHPSPFHLRPGQSYELAWILKSFAAENWKETALSIPDFALLRFEQETIFQGETFILQAELGSDIRDAEVFCNDKKIPFTVSGKTLLAEYKAEELGEYVFTLKINGRVSIARGLCQKPLEKLIEDRLRFIIRNQQNRDPESPLYGAFLIWDTEEKSQYFSHRIFDHNACRERFGMSLLLCKWLQTHKDEEMENALKLVEEFILREIFDTENGVVCNSIGKDSSFRRPYNAPWMITFWLEMYKLYRKDIYLDWIEKIFRFYYSQNVYSFYPNGSVFSDAVVMFRNAGREDTAAELQKMVQTHVETLMKNGTDYPAHEVSMEQTIVTPAHTLPASYYDLLEKREDMLEESRKHMEILVRFNGDQPDHHLYELPIRHWDGFWFGKKRLYGDTLHYWSNLSAYAFVLYGKNHPAEKEAYQAKARHCIRNVLTLFHADSTAACVYMHPFSVRMLNPDGTEAEPLKRGEYFDPWANDQDFALYLTLRILELDPSFRL